MAVGVFRLLSGAPAPLLAAYVAVLGALVGSFLNVVILRVPAGASIVFPGSACPNCHAHIAWYDNLPVLSWFLLRGKCRSCRTPISFRYAVVEALTSILFVAVFWRFGVHLATIAYFAFVATLVALTFIDIDHRIIPNVISLPGIVVGLALAFVLPHQPGVWLPVGWKSSGLGVLLGGGVLMAVAELGDFYLRLRRRKRLSILRAERARRGKGGAKVLPLSAWRPIPKISMGYGDVKLLAMIGAFLGLAAVPFVFVASAFLGAAMGILRLVITGDHSLPFGPALAAAATLYLFAGPELTAAYLRHTVILHP